MVNKRSKKYEDWVQGLKCFFGFHNFEGHWKNQYEYINLMLPDKLMCIFCGKEKNISNAQKIVELNKLKENQRDNNE